METAAKRQNARFAKTDDDDDDESDDDDVGLEGRGNEANDDEATVVAEQDEQENECVRNILRQPRYFDDDYEAAALRCFRCGQGGHREAECTLPAKKRRVTCVDSRRTSRAIVLTVYVSTVSLPVTRVETVLPARSGRDAQKLCCLRCGKSGHVVADCVYRFDASDLAQIHCYVCGSFGHLCCAPQDSQPPGRPSCCRCGAEGHLDLACAHSKRIRRWRCPRIRMFPLRRARSSLASVRRVARSVRATTGGLFESAANLRRGFGRRERRRELARQRRTRTRRSIVFRSIARIRPKVRRTGAETDEHRRHGEAAEAEAAVGVARRRHHRRKEDSVDDGR